MTFHFLIFYPKQKKNYIHKGTLEFLYFRENPGSMIQTLASGANLTTAVVTIDVDNSQCFKSQIMAAAAMDSYFYTPVLATNLALANDYSGVLYSVYDDATYDLSRLTPVDLGSIGFVGRLDRIFWGFMVVFFVFLASSNLVGLEMNLLLTESIRLAEVVRVNGGGLFFRRLVVDAVRYVRSWRRVPTFVDQQISRVERSFYHRGVERVRPAPIFASSANLFTTMAVVPAVHTFLYAVYQDIGTAIWMHVSLVLLLSYKLRGFRTRATQVYMYHTVCCVIIIWELLILSSPWYQALGAVMCTVSVATLLMLSYNHFDCHVAPGPLVQLPRLPVPARRGPANVTVRMQQQQGPARPPGGVHNAQPSQGGRSYTIVPGVGGVNIHFGPMQSAAGGHQPTQPSQSSASPPPSSNTQRQTDSDGRPHVSSTQTATPQHGDDVSAVPQTLVSGSPPRSHTQHQAGTPRDSSMLRRRSLSRRLALLMQNEQSLYPTIQRLLASATSDTVSQSGENAMRDEPSPLSEHLIQRYEASHQEHQALLQEISHELSHQLAALRADGGTGPLDSDSAPPSESISPSSAHSPPSTPPESVVDHLPPSVVASPSMLRQIPPVESGPGHERPHRHPSTGSGRPGSRPCLSCLARRQHQDAQLQQSHNQTSLGHQCHHNHAPHSQQPSHHVPSIQTHIQTQTRPASGTVHGNDVVDNEYDSMPPLEPIPELRNRTQETPTNQSRNHHGSRAPQQVRQNFRLPQDAVAELRQGRVITVNVPVQHPIPPGGPSHLSVRVEPGPNGPVVTSVVPNRIDGDSAAGGIRNPNPEQIQHALDQLQRSRTSVHANPPAGDGAAAAVFGPALPPQLQQTRIRHGHSHARSNEPPGA
eukprot:Rmarinus@m.28211